MSFFDEYLSKRLEDLEFKREWEELEEESQAEIIRLRLERLENDPSSAIPWKDVRK